MPRLSCTHTLRFGVPLVLITTQIVGAVPQGARDELTTASAATQRVRASLSRPGHPL